MEKFDIMKAIKSFFSGLDWFKSAMIALKIIGICLICLTIYKAWFEPKGGNTSNQRQRNIILGNVGTLDSRQETTQTQIAQKTWLLGVTCDTKTNNYKEEVRVGIIIGKLF